MQLDDLKILYAVLSGATLDEVARGQYVTSGAVSKALQRIQEQLGYRCLYKEGRRLLPNAQGLAMLPTLRQLLEQAESLKQSRTGSLSAQTIIGRPEHLHLWMSLYDHADIDTSSLRLQVVDDVSAALKMVQTLGGQWVTTEVPMQCRANADWKVQKLGVVSRVTVGAGHLPLTIAVSDLLNHPFGLCVSDISAKTVNDGWRDDLHPRRLTHVYEDYGLFLRGVRRGLHYGYVPESIARDEGFQRIDVLGCNLVCEEPFFLLEAAVIDTHVSP